ncbi:SAM-dependent methyltransferase [Prolixibacteraceae bacterium JC049]|nr:SAM-dependent methyltransferase [Prolixibacteraceae bacterium JC049]
MKGKIYLIPTTMGDSSVSSVIPTDVMALISELKFFIVENIRTARRYLKKVDRSIDIDELTFFELNKHTSPNDIASYLEPAKKGNNVGIISEAGCPGVADPGADVVKIAHEKQIQVVPLVGPSSILMSLMASGMNGQNFAFVGYIPIKGGERIRAIKDLEARSRREQQTQIFIEAPYRNTQMLGDLLKSCAATTRICVACDISLENEFIKTKTVAQWQKQLPNIQKRPTIFLLQA